MLQRPRHVEDIRVRVGDDIRRGGERQHQQPRQRGASREVVRGDEPRRTDADRERNEADEQHKNERVHEVGGQHGLLKVLPAIAARHEPADEYGDERQRNRCCRRQRRQKPQPAGTPSENGHRLGAAGADLGIGTSSVTDYTC